MKLSAEHTKIELEQPNAAPRIGDKIELIVGYSDTTVHLHEEIVGVRSGRVETISGALPRAASSNSRRSGRAYPGRRLPEVSA